MSLSAFESQVGGHKGTIQEDESGSILIKSTSPREVDFYQSLAPTLDASFVGKWTPWFYGTLKRQQSLPAEAAEVASQVGLAVPDSLVLENLCSHFSKPNIIDFKLGKQFWDDDSSPEKRQRMEQASRDTTSGVTGLRLTACQVWDESKKAFRATDKTFGKSLTVEQLPQAAERAFPSTADTDQQGQGEGLPPAQLLAVLRLILARLQLYTQACAEFHWRVYGSSLLIVYEGDTQKLQQALPNATAGPECEKEEADEDVEEFNEDDQTEVDGKKWAYTLKGIDFAHAWPAKDVDQGYVAGLETLKGLLQQRIDALEQSLQ